jgi:RNase P subunit RPR2|tara:strand:+ start:3624 stop:3854 length:231 start_codon:yes stop_codon:yes gene_type:complete
MAKCDFEDCQVKATLVSRLSPEGYLKSSGKKAYSFREAYERFNYCKECHDRLMKEVWSRVRSSDGKDDDHVAPTAV